MGLLRRQWAHNPIAQHHSCACLHDYEALTDTFAAMGSNVHVSLQRTNLHGLQ
jgi:hypothetical protein